MIHKGEKMKMKYDKEVIKNFDFFGYFEKMFHSVEKFITPRMCALDVGTGFGRGTRYLASKIKEKSNQGGKVYSIDLSDEMQNYVAEILEEEQLRDLVEFRIANVEKMNDFKDSYFDLILAVNCLHHFSNPINAINEMLRVLKDDGTICIIDWSKKAKFLPHKKEDLFELSDFKNMGFKIIEAHSEPYWWFAAVRK